MLAHYVQQFNTVEVNNTFFTDCPQEEFGRLADSTPGDFHFAVKGSRYLTHMKKLKNAGEGVERFLEAVNVLGKKLGPIFFQLPPNWEDVGPAGGIPGVASEALPLCLRISERNLERARDLRPAEEVQSRILHL